MNGTPEQDRAYAAYRRAQDAYNSVSRGGSGLETEARVKRALLDAIDGLRVAMQGSGRRGDGCGKDFKVEG